MHRITTETSGLVSVLGEQADADTAPSPRRFVDRVCGELQVCTRSTTAATRYRAVEGSGRRPVCGRNYG